ncbi:MAG TPA: hypothetical protein VJB35_06615 [Candidatus Nanoarchaeia archaeon]|nr:hypothetical protein [Candidatus Nanoarchaeia archaeon]
MLLENQNLIIGALIPGSILAVLIIGGSIIKLIEMEATKREKIIFFFLGFFMIISIGVTVFMGIHEKWFLIPIPILIFSGLAITTGIKSLFVKEMSCISMLITGEIAGMGLILLLNL